MKKYLVSIGFLAIFPGDGMTKDDYEFYPEVIEADSPEDAERKAIEKYNHEDRFCGARCDREATKEEIEADELEEDYRKMGWLQFED